MANVYSILYSSTSNLDYYNANPPYSEGSYAPHASTNDALSWFVTNFATIFSGYGVYPSATRVSYPVLRTGLASNPFDIYLPDLGGFYSQFNYTVTTYAYYFTVYTLENPEGIDFRNLLIYYAPETSSPPPPPAEVTIQLKRDNTLSKYSVKPSDASVLAKYYNPVKQIRAKFATTRIAIIEETMHGGFLIYEEVGGVAISPVYIYNGQRRLIEIIDAAIIGQYRSV